MTEKLRPIVYYFIAELIIVSAIVFGLFKLAGVDFKDHEYTRAVKAGELCQCDYDNAGFRDLARVRYELTEITYKNIYGNYYSNRTVVIKGMKSGYQYVLLMVIVIMAYFFTVGFISLIASTVSDRYYYGFCPISEAIVWLVRLPRKRAERRTAEREELNTRSAGHLSSAIAGLDKFLK